MARIVSAVRLARTCLAALALAACASSAAMVLPPPGQDPQAVRVFFATDRVDLGSPAAADRFAAVGGALTYGAVHVRMPDAHAVGAIEAPSFWDFGASEDPARHVMLHDPAEILTEAAFAAAVGDAASGGVLVVIHGFNKTFAEAAEYAAQIAYDLDFRGPVVAYSWPSAGDMMRYSDDVIAARATTAHLQQVLGQLAETAGLGRAHVIVHSLGIVPFLGAVDGLARQQAGAQPMLGQVVMMAPDMGFREFADHAPSLLALSAQASLYVSTGDRALAVSREFFHDEQRVGEVLAGSVAVIDGIDTIDAGPVDDSDLGHSYYHNNRAVLADVYQLIACGCGPDGRFGLRPVDTAAGRFWHFAH